MYSIIDDYSILSEPKIPYMKPPMIEFPLASLVECMRLILFIFIVTVSLTFSQLASTTFGVFVDVASNFDQHFSRLVPTLIAVG